MPKRKVGERVAELEAEMARLCADIEKQNRDLGEHQARWQRAERQLEAARAALAELVSCKDMKTAEGKTPEYLVRQAKAWRRARLAQTGEGGDA